MEELENKYIELLLKKCLNFEKGKSLLIHVDFKEHLKFAEKIKEKAIEMGINDICICCNDLDDIHEYLKNTNLEDIKLNPLISRSDWDVYAKKSGGLLFLNSTVPELMDDIPTEKIQKWFSERAKSETYYRKYVKSYVFSWTIAALPNERWGKYVFPNEENSYEKLFLYILKMCMVDKKDPVIAWDEYIKQNNFYKDKLNQLEITKMHYTNSLGTDLYVEKPKENKWMNLDKKAITGRDMIVNMPSYEVFTTPDCRKTNGIVFSSRPLIYGDAIIDNFSLTFKDGHVIKCEAKVGQEILEKLIYENKNGDLLGEVALVPHDSPISNTNVVYNETLFDENASCHLALGSGFPLAFPNYNGENEEQLYELGFNKTNVHTDFMIGTGDLSIEADTNQGKKLIFKKGNFNI